ncbi:hypothetical protein GYMLUDRAFT_43486 [Collybiopsis luxurians FD-317 M1]|uniref:Uncharacterized protein n=1 Tax=Collybiopsis luxurians FD-317 M1 TaxID=944289 RepID=A0A0D0CPV0_9AGAR|nr:hypothetical protein GYMLUDRAFT_43486 [Collybiopsis luxurians FD-317 M1]
MASSDHQHSSSDHRTHERRNSHSERRNTNPHASSHGVPHASSPRADPTVLHGSQDWQYIGGTMLPGSFSAVTGNQVIQKRSPHSASSSVRPSSHRQTHHTPKTDLSVLREYHRHDNRDPYAAPSGTTFGKASFSAVAGHQDFIYDRYYTTTERMNRIFLQHLIVSLTVRTNYRALMLTQVEITLSSSPEATAPFMDIPELVVHTHPAF